MKIESSTDIDYLNILIQWGFFFSIVAILVLPAILFYNLAKKYNRKGWLYAIIGLAVGFIFLNLLSLITLTVKTYVTFEINQYLFAVTYLLLGSSFIWAAYEFLKVIFDRSK